METALASRGLHITHAEPPRWRAPWLQAATNPPEADSKSGYPGFYPTHPGQQDEDTINEQVVHRGYNAQPAVTVPCPSLLILQSILRR